MSQLPRTLVIIPAYNEADTIASVIHQISDCCPDYDVLVVDDGSTDQTAAIVQETARASLLRLPFNLGIGGAMQSGFLYAVRAGYEVAVQCDADGQHPVPEIPALVDRVIDGSADVIIGSRYVKNTQYQPSFVRRVGKSLLSRWVDLLIGGGITDTTSGFRAINRRALEVLSRTYPEDYPEPEALVILHKHGLKVAEVSVEMSPRQGGATSITSPGAVYYMVKVALAIFVDLFRSYASAERR